MTNSPSLTNDQAERYDEVFQTHAMPSEHRAAFVTFVETGEYLEVDENFREAMDGKRYEQALEDALRVAYPNACGIR